MFIYVNFAVAGNFFSFDSSILVTTYAVPPRGRRPYTDAHILLATTLNPDLRIQAELFA